MSKIHTFPRPYLNDVINNSKSKSITVTKSRSSEFTVALTDPKSYLIKAKYTSRKKVKGKWVYTYGISKKSKKGIAQEFKPFVDIATKNNYDVDKTYEALSQVTDVTLSTSEKFREVYGKEGESPKESVKNFINAIKPKNKLTGTESSTHWENLFKDAPESFISDTVEYYKNKKLQWNAGQIQITPKEKNEIIAVQQAVDKLGLTTKYYPEYTSKIVKARIQVSNGLLVMKKAGTFSGYKLQDKYTFAGFPLSIENKKGKHREWTDSDGNKGKTLMKYDYGYIKGTEGKDGDHVDVFVGDNEESDNVFVVHQTVPDSGKYDEDKVMLGFVNAKQAKEAYLQHYNDSRFFGSMTVMSMDKFRDRVYKTLNSQRKSLKALLIKENRPDILLKAKTYKVGEISVKTGKKKVAPGKWEDVGKDKPAKPDGSKKDKPTKPDTKDKPKKPSDDKKSGMSKIGEAIKSGVKSIMEAMTDYYSGQSGAQEVAQGTKEVGEKLKQKDKNDNKVEGDKK